ncbi:MAG TPA: CHAD domain-containing protein [Solirubrobacteraceae bacterium]|nr:CHAD domain-containing protein [Solirubrobacteraceae bacterium]
MATVAAGVAVGLGVAVARAGQERQRRRRTGEPHLPGGAAAPPRPTRPGPPPPPPPAAPPARTTGDEQLGATLQRMAIAQIDYALIRLRPGDAAPDAQAVHDTRKTIKRLRALVRLLEGHLGPEARKREDRALARTAKMLSGARDSEVMLESLDLLVKRNHGRLGHRAGVGRVRRMLAAESERVARDALGDPAVRARAAGELRALRERIGAWQLTGRGRSDLVEPGLVRIYRDGRRRCRRAESGKARSASDMHAWRRRVKDLRYSAEMLAACEGRGGEGERARLTRIAKRANVLGETLGEEHDLVMLAAWLEEAPRKGPKAERVGRRTRRALKRAIARRRRKLRRRALRDGERLYRRRPREVAEIARNALSPR